MHRHHALQRHQVVHYREDRFLYFPGISGVADDTNSAGKVEDYESLACRSIDLGNRFERWYGDDREVGHMPAIVFIGLREDEHVAGKHRMPRFLRDDANRHPVLRVGTDVAILDEHVASLHEPEEAVVQSVEFIGWERLVILSPPYVFIRRRFADDVFIACGAGGVLSRESDDWTETGYPTLSPESDFLIKSFRG
jgi:hypothetical protein